MNRYNYELVYLKKNNFHIMTEYVEDIEPPCPLHIPPKISKKIDKIKGKYPYMVYSLGTFGDKGGYCSWSNASLFHKRFKAG